MAERTLAKAYSPREHEPACLDRWTLDRCFHAEPGDAGAPYSVFIPPPNVTAALHLGHALNNTLQDVLVRVARMRGANAMWMPGTDHAGIATQTVVEKRLLQQGVRRTDLSREDFVAKVQEWKDEYEAVILDQLRAMGASCDYDRVRFTMDPVCTAAVREAFFRLFRDGLIYRGKRLVNWDPVSQTALADDEVEMEELDGHFWYLRYPLEDGSGHVTVATTRPETMLGDTGVAINPRDPRAAALRGKRLRLPIVGRVIPIVEDDYVVMPVSLGGDPADPKAQFASGFLKVTPAHDANDWEIGLRHGLAAINVMAPDASISDRHGWTDVSSDARAFVGMSREDARAAIVRWFREHELLEDAKPYRHSVGHSYRSHVPVEPYLSDQWYVRVTDDRLRGAALRAMAPEQVDGALPSGVATGAARAGDGELRFFPPRYARTFQQWHEGIRDWCISRQLWWGHRIPVWSRLVRVDAQGPDLPAAAAAALDAASSGTDAGLAIRANRVADGASIELRGDVAAGLRAAGPGEYALHACARDDAAAAALEAHGFVRDPDVLDTWFSSALWPMSTLGWPDPVRFGMGGLLDTWNPSAVLSTAREIITLWVSRMVMMNRYLLDGRVPFRHVFIHSIVQDGYGQKMSKSLGNGVDPRDIIATHGADALRFCLVQMSTGTQDVRLPVDVLCPFTGEPFAPKTVTTPSGHTVAAPIQSCPKDPTKRMVTAFGASSGQAVPTDDMPLARNTSARFDIGRNFANKMWNATRFALAQFPEGGDPAQGTSRPQRLVDRWMLATFARAVRAVNESVDGYQFNACAEALYNLVWRDFCDWYLEAIKPTVKSDPVQRAVLRSVLNGSMRLMHPVMPFVTEALWPWVQGIEGPPVGGLRLEPSPMLVRARWPAADETLDDADAIARFSRVQALVLAIRNVRGERGVEVKRRITLHVPPATAAIVDDGSGVVETLAGLAGVVTLDAATRPADAVPVAFEGEEFWLSGLVDAVDAAAERQRLAKTISDRERLAAGYRSKLSNPGYLAKAKPELVDETRNLLAKAEADIAAARRASEALAAD
jgi:valyl-tRNA synthetase